jgi:hypothetical protein
MPRKVAILLYENDNYPKGASHFIWSLCEVWRERGIEIEILKGTQKIAEADLLIPHLDTTILPRAYIDFFQNYRQVVNRSLHDISKRIISRNLLTREDAYDGPVIVKTDFNSGGISDFNFEGPRISFSSRRKKRFWSRLFGAKQQAASPNWEKLNCLDPADYQVFPSLKEVPEAVFLNKWLVVERFLPEFENGIYYLRVYKFFGDRALCVRVGSPRPIVKQGDIISREEISIPDEIVAVRHELGMDFGKFDFVIHQGKMVLFDVNYTPGRLQSQEQMKQNALKLAPGIESLF